MRITILAPDDVQMFHNLGEISRLGQPVRILVTGEGGGAAFTGHISAVESSSENSLRNEQLQV
jgi:hypothetical protein